MPYIKSEERQVFNMSIHIASVNIETPGQLNYFAIIYLTQEEVYNAAHEFQSFHFQDGPEAPQVLVPDPRSNHHETGGLDFWGRCSQCVEKQGARNAHS